MTPILAQIVRLAKIQFSTRSKQTMVIQFRLHMKISTEKSADSCKTIFEFNTRFLHKNEDPRELNRNGKKLCREAPMTTEGESLIFHRHP